MPIVTQLFQAIEGKLFVGLARGVYAHVDAIKNLVKDYPLSVTITAIALAALGFCLAHLALNQLPVICVSRYLLKATEWAIGGFVFWIIKNALEAMVQKNSSKTKLQDTSSS